MTPVGRKNGLVLAVPPPPQGRRGLSLVIVIALALAWGMVIWKGGELYAQTANPAYLVAVPGVLLLGAYIVWQARRPEIAFILMILTSCFVSVEPAPTDIVAVLAIATAFCRCLTSVEKHIRLSVYDLMWGAYLLAAARGAYRRLLVRPFLFCYGSHRLSPYEVRGKGGPPDRPPYVGAGPC